MFFNNGTERHVVCVTARVPRQRKKRDHQLVTSHAYKSTKERTTKEITVNWMFIWNKNTRNIYVRS